LSKANFEEKKDMILAELFSKYSTEIKAKKAFKAFRDEQGVICKKCKNTTHYWKQDKWQYECKACRFRTTLRSGTVMESSNLPFRYWMIAIGLMSATKKSFSAMEVQRQLNHKRYEPIWSMLHKIRASMGRRDDKYKLDGQIEMDEGYFVGQKEKETNNKPPMYSAHGNKGKRNVKVLVSVQSRLTIQSNKNKPNRKVGFIKMKVIETVTKDAVNHEVAKSISKTANVLTDGKGCYNDLKKMVSSHKVKICKDKKEVSKIFPWVHIAISNAKKMCLGIHHSIKGTFMQNYLDEFCYKFNRRYFGDRLFDRLIVACIENN
jgi:hypothetical protein